MKKLLFLPCFSVLLLFTALGPTAQADTVRTFDLSGIYSPALYGTGVADGSFTVNTTTGVVLSIDFDYVGRSPNQVRAPGVYVNTFNGITELGTNFGGNGTGTIPTALTIVVPVTTFVGYTGGLICSVAHPCYENSSFYNPLGRTSPFLDGNLGVTPEPSEFSYMILSVLGLASAPVVRKRLSTVPGE